MDARAVAEAATVIDGVATGDLQSVSQITSFSFKSAVAELVQHGILSPSGDALEFTSRQSRRSPASSLLTVV
jgi:hypothetical protein